MRTHAAAYFEVLLLGAPLAFAGFALMSFFQGRGDTRTPMVATVAANLLNIVLDPIFVFGWGPVPALEVRGAAVATVLGQALMVALLLWPFWVRDAVPGAPRGLDRPTLRAIWRLGSPLGVMEVLDLGAFAAFASILTAAGEVHLAAHILVMRIVSLSFLPGFAIGSATGVLVGQAVGARRAEAAGDAIRSGLGLAVGGMALAGLAFVAVPELLVAPFGVGPELERASRRLLRVAAAFQIFDAVVMVLYNALTGAGDTRFVMRAGVGASWLVKVPVAWALALPAGLGSVGAWFGFTVELLLLATLFGWRVRGGAWWSAAVAEAEAERAVAWSGRSGGERAVGPAFEAA